MSPTAHSESPSTISPSHASLWFCTLQTHPELPLSFDILFLTSNYGIIDPSLNVLSLKLSITLAFVREIRWGWMDIGPTEVIGKVSLLILK